MRQKNLAIYLFLIFFIVSAPQAFAGKKILADWNTNSALDAAWGDSNILDLQVYVANGELNHIVRPYSSSETNFYLDARTRFLYSDAISLVGFQSTVRIDSIGDIKSATEIDYASVGYFGFYYNINATPISAAGDILFVVRFGDRGNGLEAWYYLSRVEDANYDSVTDLETGIFTPPAGGWKTGNNYTFKVVYDDNTSFVASLGGQPTDTPTITGPAKGNSAYFPGKWIRSRVKLNQPFSGDPDTNKIHAVFDDVQIDKGSGFAIHDDFNAADESLSNQKWDDRYLARQSTVSNNKLKVSLKSADGDTIDNTGIRYEIKLPFEHKNTSFLQADMEIKSGVTRDTSRGLLEIGGGWGNGKHSSEPGTEDGSINMYARVQKGQQAPYHYGVLCWADMCNDANCDTWISFFEDNWTQANPDTMYTASLKKQGSTLSCTVKETITGNVLISTSKDLTQHGISQIYPITEYSKRLRVRVRNSWGEAAGYFDNVYVEGGSPMLLNIVPIITTQPREE